MSTDKPAKRIQATNGALGTVWISTPAGEEYRLSWERGRMVISAQRVNGDLAVEIIARPITGNTIAISAEGQ